MGYENTDDIQRFLRLPTWARNEIRSLQRQVTELTEECNRLREQSDDNSAASS